MIYSQDTLSVKDGAYGYEKEFKLDLHMTTATAIKALQFDIKYDGNNFTYKSSFSLTKARLGGDDSDHVITVKEVSSGNLRILIYSPSNKAIPTGNGELLKVDFENNKNHGNYTFELASVVASKEDNTNLTLKLENGTITTLAPQITYNPSTIDFGSVYKDAVKDVKWIISNEGTDTLNVSLNKSELTKFNLTQWDDKTTVITWPVKILPVGEGNNNNLEILDANGISISSVNSRDRHLNLPLIAGQGANKHVKEALFIYHHNLIFSEQLIGLVRVGNRRWNMDLINNRRVMLPSEGVNKALKKMIELNSIYEFSSKNFNVLDFRNINRVIIRKNNEPTQTIEIKLDKLERGEI